MVVVNAKPPNWCMFACISDDPVLASVISSYFNSTGEYFAVMAGPHMTMPDWENEVIQKVNVCAMLRIQRVILAGLSSVAVDSFVKRRPDFDFIIANSLEEWPDAAARVGVTAPVAVTKCNPDELLWGVALAKRLGKRLEVAAGFPSVREAIETSRFSGHCVMVDDMDGVVPVIAGNYIFAVEADVRGLPPVDFDEIDSIYDGIQESGNRKDPNRRSRARSFVERQGARFASSIDSRGFGFITFITRGVPYGYFVSHVPTTHLYSYLDLGRHIANSIYYAATVADTRLALVVDPGFFADSESTDVTTSLRSRRVKVKELRGQDATRRNVDHYIRYYPYDFLYICTHAGELSEGERLTIQFSTSDGTSHVFVMDVAHTFVPLEPEHGKEPMIDVIHFTRPVELDGVAWTDDEGKRRIGAGDTLRQFTEISPRDWNVTNSQDTDTIRDFPVIEATDGPVSLVSEYFAGGGLARPIVFNNACNSLHKLSTWLILAGARGYIGTLTRVPDKPAKELGRTFFRKLTDERSVAILLHESQQAIIANPMERVYIHFGCHFNAIRQPGRDVSSYPQLALRREIKGWRDYLSEDHPEKFKQTVQRILLFVERALREEP